MKKQNMNPFWIRKIVFLLTILSAFVLSACAGSGQKAKNETDILSDVQENDYYFQEHSLKVDSYQVSKRQTNQEDKTDYVWFACEASNEDVSYTAEYTLTYVLYNEGWLLEDYERTSFDASPNRYPTEEDAIRYIEMYYGGCTLTETSQSERRIVYRFEREESVNYRLSRYSDEVIYTFSPDDGWSLDMVEEVMGTTLDFVGEWGYQDDERSFYVNVLECDNNKVKIQFDLVNAPVFRSDPVTMKSENPVVMGLYGAWFAWFQNPDDNIPDNLRHNVHIYFDTQGEDVGVQIGDLMDVTHLYRLTLLNDN